MITASRGLRPIRVASKPVTLIPRNQGCALVERVSCFVLTIDQRGSERAGDRVPALLESLHVAPGVDCAVPAERTVGDEVQLVVADGVSVVAVVEVCTRQAGWAVGIGAGEVSEPLPTSSRSARGPAFDAARRAVERAKRTPARLAVRGGADPSVARHAESALWLLLAVESRRTRRGWQVVDAVRAHGTQTAAADALGVTAQDVSQVLLAAGWAACERGRTLSAHLLEQL